jgi:hypothetical protein
MMALVFAGCHARTAVTEPPAPPPAEGITEAGQGTPPGTDDAGARPEADIPLDALVETAPDATTVADSGQSTALDANAAADSGQSTAMMPRYCLLPLGDSITQGDANHLSYRYWLWQALRERGYSVDFLGSMTSHFGGTPTYPDQTFDVDHEAHWGWRADEVLALLPAWLERYRPGVALVHLGTNDAYQGQGVDETAGELRQIVAALRHANPRVVVLLAQIIPIAIGSSSSTVTALNEAIRQLAPTITSPDSPVIVVDQFGDFDPDLDSYDGAHPNERGERKMALRWLDALLPELDAGRGRCPD